MIKFVINFVNTLVTAVLSSNTKLQVNAEPKSHKESESPKIVPRLEKQQQKGLDKVFPRCIITNRKNS